MFGKQAEVVVPANREVVAYDAATGQKAWSAPTPSDGIPSPTVSGDLLLMPSRGVVALGLKGGKANERWKSPKLTTGLSSPLAYGGRVYAANPTGIVVSAAAASGKVPWQERVKGSFSGPPVAGDGKLYLVNENGVLTTLQLGDKPEVLAESKTNEEGLATPAISGGAIFFRGEKTLFCVGGRAGG